MHEHQGHETKGAEAPCGCCHDKRNRFFRGKQMNAEAFALEQDYHIGRRRLVNRAVLGWGVVRGFAVPHAGAKGAAPAPVEVGSGVGLDRGGREVVSARAVTLTSKNTFILDGCRPRPADTVPHGEYVLSVHYAERRVEDARSADECGCGEPEKQFVCEAVVFSLKPLHDACCPCAEDPCRPCACRAHPSSCADGRRSCLCEWAATADDVCGASELCEWNGYWIDPCGGLPLACVHASGGDTRDPNCPPRSCEPILLRVDDNCGPRRIVKSNDLLYDLARGCDLTRIAWTSWDKWHRLPDPVPWRDFAGMFHAESATKDTTPVKTDFVVRFSGPVLSDTLKPDAVVLTVITADQQTGWLVARRIPVDHLHLDPDPAHGGIPPTGTTNRFRIYVKSDWYWDEVERSRSSLTRETFAVEIEVRGDYILDCRRVRIDGNARAEAGDPTPSGVGVEGKTFLSTFRVEPKEEGAA